MRTKNILPLSLLFLLVTALPGQVLLNLPPGEGCNYDGSTSEVESIYGFEPSDKAQAVIDEIMSLMGLSSNFEIMAANVDNALAHTQGGKRYILYNERFMNQVFDRTADYWASVSILAHEIGHHLNGHTLTAEGSRPELELAADQFSGFVLYKLGATMVQAELAVQTLANDRGTSTHPPKRARLQAIAVGYRQAEEEVGKLPEKKSGEKKGTPNLGNNEALIGGELYPTVRLYGLTWMAKNLNYKVDDSWCYDDDPVNCYTNGRLYTWQAAQKACSELGWRLPTDDEWGSLIGSFGGYEKAYEALQEGGSDNNRRGFTAQFGGLLDYDGEFVNLGRWGCYWGATERDSGSAWRYGFNRYLGELTRDYNDKSRGYSCRCVQDAPSNGID